MSAPDREALIGWSAVAEPGDKDAGALVAALGPAAALGWVWRADGELAVATSDLAITHGPDLAARAARAHERWIGRIELAESPHEVRSHAVGAHIVVRGEPGWPRAFADLGEAEPFALYVRGGADLNAAWARSVAIVGARAATGYGAFVAGDLAAPLARDGWTVLSGGAYGIDAAAHRAALAAEGQTVAVMAGGVDRLYPAGNEELLRNVIESGAVVSEVPPGFAPHRSRFLSRNRLIGAASATVVVEAAHRSGALSTARHAAELLRPVGAVPGPVTSASSAGCHDLVRDNLAVLVTCVREVVELAAPATEWAELLTAERDSRSPSPEGAGGRAATAPKEVPSRGALAAPGQGAPDFASPHERMLYDAAGKRGVSADRLAANAGVELRAALAALGALEAKGLLRREHGLWTRSPSPTGSTRALASHPDNG